MIDAPKFARLSPFARATFSETENAPDEGGALGVETKQGYSKIKRLLSDGRRFSTTQPTPFPSTPYQTPPPRFFLSPKIMAFFEKLYTVQ